MTREHLSQVEKFLEKNPIESARMAVAQTLERLRMDVALRERMLPAVAQFLRKP
jgi:puromycin-sensitive aminopeptidase